MGGGQEGKGGKKWGSGDGSLLSIAYGRALHSSPMFFFSTLFLERHSTSYALHLSSSHAHVPPGRASSCGRSPGEGSCKRGITARVSSTLLATQLRGRKGTVKQKSFSSGWSSLVFFSSVHGAKRITQKAPSKPHGPVSHQRGGCAVKHNPEMPFTHSSKPRKLFSKGNEHGEPFALRLVLTQTH